MTEAEIRALVREVIARHVASDAGYSDVRGEHAVLRQHASHAMFVLPNGASVDGVCVIEPGVACNHCGYCKSYGH